MTTSMNGPDASTAYSCAYSAVARMCTVELVCVGCSFELGSELSVAFLFGGEIFASSLSVSVSTSTGVEDDVSSITSTFHPSNNNFVLRGYPETSLTVEWVPTQYVTVNNLVEQRDVTSTGFHVSSGSATVGNAVDQISISRYRSVPLRLNIVVDNTVLSVTRKPKTTFLDFLSQMLGSIGGISGVLVFFMQRIDAVKVDRRHDNRRDALEEEAALTLADGDEGTPSPTDSLSAKLLTRSEEAPSFRLRTKFERPNIPSPDIQKPSDAEEMASML